MNKHGTRLVCELLDEDERANEDVGTRDIALEGSEVGRAAELQEQNERRVSEATSALCCTTRFLHAR